MNAVFIFPTYFPPHPRGVAIIIIVNGISNPSSNPGHGCLYFTLCKSMNPYILPPAIGKYLGRLGFLALVKQSVYEKENFKFKPDVLYLKFDLLSHLAHGKGVG